MKATSILETIGRTPVLRLSHLAARRGGSVAIKLEHLNPGGSYWDRAGRTAVRRAERSGQLGPGAAVIARVDGEAAIGLALACAASGHPLIVLAGPLAPSWRALLSAHRVQIERISGEGSGPTIEERLTALRGAKPGACVLDPRAVEIAEEVFGEIGEELAQAMEADRTPPAAFVGCFEDEEALARLGKPLARHFPAIQIVDAKAEPSFKEGEAVRRRLAKEEGLLVGPRTGAAVAVALGLASGLNPNGCVCTLSFDGGERYFESHPS